MLRRSGVLSYEIGKQSFSNVFSLIALTGRYGGIPVIELGRI
jgi:hypothetical protein